MAKKNITLIISTVAIHILYLAVLYIILYIFNRYGLLVTSIAEISRSNIVTQLGCHMAIMLLFPLAVIAICRAKPYALGISAKNLYLCVALLAIYIAFFFLINDFSAGGLFRAVYLLFSIGLGEELFFRGWSYLRLKTVNPWLSIVVSGFFFGAAHVIYPGIISGLSIPEIVLGMFGIGDVSVNLFEGVLVGLMFVLLLEYSGNLVVPILIHALYDYANSLDDSIQWLGVLVIILTFIYLIVKRIVFEKQSFFPIKWRG